MLLWQEQPEHGIDEPKHAEDWCGLGIVGQAWQAGIV